MSCVGLGKLTSVMMVIFYIRGHVWQSCYVRAAGAIRLDSLGFVLFFVSRPSLPPPAGVKGSLNVTKQGIQGATGITKAAAKGGLKGVTTGT